MGQTIVPIIIYGPAGSRRCDGLVDTGATFTKLPRGIAEEAGLEVFREIPVELADGRTITRPLAQVEVEIQGVRMPVIVAIAENGDRPLIGYTTLELLGFKVDLVAHALEKTNAIEY